MIGNQIVAIETGANCRIVCVSDIHGNLSLLQLLLDKLCFTDNDILIFLGDYVGKGSDNEGVIDLLMELSKRPGTYFIQGNHDRVNNWLVRQADEEEALKFISWQPNTLLCELALKEGITCLTRDNLASVRVMVMEKYFAKLDWLVSHPIAIEIETFVFAHAGLEERTDWKNSNPLMVVRNDGFLKKGTNLSGKRLVVGHWPTYNIFENGPTNNPVIFEDRHIIGIDGGCNTKSFPQLNAFIIKVADGDIKFSNVFADPSPVEVITADYVSQDKGTFLKDSWPDFELELLKKGEYFSLCRIKTSGRTGLVKNEHIKMDEEGNCSYLKNSVSNQLTVTRGEKVYLLDDECSGFALVKNMDGIMGWVPWKVLR